MTFYIRTEFCCIVALCCSCFPSFVRQTSAFHGKPQGQDTLNKVSAQCHRNRKKKQFVLLGCLDGETVCEMPLTTMHNDDRAYIGALVKGRWNGRKLHDAEILKI